LKGNNWKRKIKTLQSKISFLFKGNLELSSQSKKLEMEESSKHQELKNQEENFSETMKNLKQSSLDLEEELLRKEEELIETRKDLNDIQKILTGMNEIFLSVQQKMDEKRKEINELNLNYFELAFHSQDFDVLDEGFREVFAEASKAKLLKEKMKKKFGKVKGIYKNIHELPVKTEIVVGRLSALDQFIESILDEKEVESILVDCKNDLAGMIKAFEISLEKPFKILQENERQSKNQRLNDGNLKSSLLAINSEIEVIDSQKVNVMLDSVLSELKNQEFVFRESQELLNQNLESLQDSLKSELSNIKSLTASNHSQDTKLKSLVSQLNQSENRILKTQQQKKSDMIQIEELKTELSSLERKLSRHNLNLELHGTPGASRKLRNIQNQVLMLHEEIFEKDSLLLKKYFEILKSLKSCKTLEKTIKNLEEITEKVKENILSKVHGEVENKDKEIEMLKEILRENASEIKSRDQKLFQMRKQIDSLLKPIPK
jgi:chromosome segregation ATPase